MDLLQTAEKIGITGFMHPAELEKLAELAVGKDVLEIGSFKGLSAWAMGIGASHVTACDSFKANSAGQVQLPHLTTLDDFSQAVSRYSHVTVHVMTSAQAAEVIQEDFDMIFLDAMHTYEDVKADIARWWPRVREGGIFVMHDYRHWDFPDVERAADEFFGVAPEGSTLITLRWVEKR